MQKKLLQKRKVAIFDIDPFDFAQGKTLTKIIFITHA